VCLEQVEKTDSSLDYSPSASSSSSSSSGSSALVGAMGVETANIVLVVIIIIVFFMLISACCRQLRNAYEEQLSLEELERRRQAFIYGSDDPNSCHSSSLHSHSGSFDDDHHRPVRVRAITAGGGDRVFGVYEIRMPRRARGFFSRAVAPPPPFHTALQNSSPIYYIDPEEPPPSYEEYLKTQPVSSESSSSASVVNNISSTTAIQYPSTVVTIEESQTDGQSQQSRKTDKF